MIDEPTMRKLRFSRTLQLIAVIGFAIATVARAVTTGFELWTILFGLLTVLTAATWVATDRTIKRYASEGQ